MRRSGNSLYRTVSQRFVDLFPLTAGRTDNPVDIPSLGLSPIELFVSKLWHCGPDWLQLGNTLKSPSEMKEMPSECLAEMKVGDKKTHTLLTCEVASLDKVIRCKEHSSLSRLTSVTSYVKFVQALKRAISHSPDSLDAEEPSTAEVLWIRESQRQLMEDKHFTTWTKQFGLFRDENHIIMEM